MIIYGWFIYYGFPVYKIYKINYPEVLLEALKNKIALKSFCLFIKNDNDCLFK